MKNTSNIFKTFLALMLVLFFVFALGGYAAAQSCYPPPEGLVSWWPGDTDASDIQGTNAGVLTNGASAGAPGKVAGAFSFDGVDDFVQFPTQPVANLIGAQFTIDFWANPGTSPDRPTFGFAGSSTTNAYNPIASYDGPSGYWGKLTIGNGSGYQLLDPLPDAPANTWTHYAIVDNGKEYIVYMNGEEVYPPGPIPISINPHSSTDRTFVIGQSGFSGGYADFFNGLIDEVEIFNRALSAEEIQAIYDAGSEGKCKPGTTIEVDIDIKPGSYPNSINLGSQGLIPVAILSSNDFDATTVDPDTVELAGSQVAVRGKGNKYLAHSEDVDGDGLVDLVCQVATANLDPGSFQNGYAVLTGETYEGDSFEGIDEINIVPPE